MSLVRIIIATTASPVTVQRITEEDPDVSSVVCLAGKAMALPISPAYDAFVRDPTGVIQRHFGHPAFRVDVSEKIDEGYSWQLGLFAAHALHHTGRLAKQDDAAERIVIATGEVDRDLNVLAVTGNHEKTNALHSQVEALLGDTQKVTLAVPKENADHWSAAFSDLLDKNPDDFQILAVSSVVQVLDHLQINLPHRQAQPTQAPPQSRKSALIIGALILLIGGTVAGGASYSPQIKMLGGTITKAVREFVTPIQTVPSKPITAPVPAPSSTTAKPVAKVVTPKPAIPDKPPAASEKDVLYTSRQPSRIAKPAQVQLSELRAPSGYNCEKTRRMDIKAIARPASQRGAIGVIGDGLNKLCTVEIDAATDENTDFIFGRYQRWTQGRPSNTPPDKVIDLGPRKASVSWSVDIPSHLQRPAIFQVLILSSRQPFEVTKKMRKRLNRIRSEGEVFIKIKKRLQQAGLVLTLKQFRIVPDRDRLLRRPDRQAAPGPLLPSPPPPRGG